MLICGANIRMITGPQVLHAWIPADAIDPELAAQRHSSTANSVTYLMEGHDLVQKYMVRSLSHNCGRALPCSRHALRMPGLRNMPAASSLPHGFSSQRIRLPVKQVLQSRTHTESRPHPDPSSDSQPRL